MSIAPKNDGSKTAEVKSAPASTRELPSFTQRLSPLALKDKELRAALNSQYPFAEQHSLFFSLENSPGSRDSSVPLTNLPLLDNATLPGLPQKKIDCTAYLSMKPLEFSTAIRTMARGELFALHSQLAAQLSHPPQGDRDMPENGIEQGNLSRKLAETTLLISLRIEGAPLRSFIRYFEMQQGLDFRNSELKANQLCADSPYPYFDQALALLQPIERKLLYLALKSKSQNLGSFYFEGSAQAISTNQAMLAALETSYAQEVLPLKDAPNLSDQAFKALKREIDKLTAKQEQILEQVTATAPGTALERYLQAKQAAKGLDLFSPLLQNLADDLELFSARTEYAGFEFSYPKLDDAAGLERFSSRIQRTVSGNLVAFKNHLEEKLISISTEFPEAGEERKKEIIRDTSAIAQAKNIINSVLQARSDSARFEIFDQLLLQPELLSKVCNETIPASELAALYNYLAYEEKQAARLCSSSEAQKAYHLAQESVLLSFIRQKTSSL